jgi:hypothetical protein
VGSLAHTRVLAAAAVALAAGLGEGACSTTPTFVQDTTGAGGHSAAAATSSGTTHAAGSSVSAGVGGTGGTSSSAATTGTTSSTTATTATTSSTGGSSSSSTSASSAASSSGCTPNVCGAAQCGVLPDGCGGTLQCGSCGSGQVCASNACCTPQSCAALGKDCDFPSDGCGGTVDCGLCPQGDACGAGGTPNVCAQVTLIQCGSTCPANTNLLASVTTGNCGGGTCGSPGAAVVCAYQGANVAYGCDYATACPSGWQIVAGYINCTCPNFSNYWVCAPP